jgi:hypothetical protein
MDLSDDEVQQLAESDRREVDPPIQVQTATWSKAGQLDWWVKERQEWLGRVRGADGRSKLLIFVLRAAQSPDMKSYPPAHRGRIVTRLPGPPGRQDGLSSSREPLTNTNR